MGPPGDCGRDEPGLLDFSKEFDLHSKSSGKKLKILTNILLKLFF